MEEFEDELPDEAYELLAKLLPLHPAIANSNLNGKNKCYLQYALEEEFDNVIKPRTPIAVTITDPPINQNQKGFLRFLSVSSTTSMTFSMMVLSSFMVNISFKDG